MRRRLTVLLPAILAGVSLIAAPQGQRGTPPPAASPTQQPKGTSVIAGQVIDAGTNLPIAGATVMTNPRLAAGRGGVPAVSTTGSGGQTVIVGGPTPTVANAPIRLIT